MNILYIAQWLFSGNSEFCSIPMFLHAVRNFLNQKGFSSKQLSTYFYRETMTSFLNYITATLLALLRDAAQLKLNSPLFTEDKQELNFDIFYQKLRCPKPVCAKQDIWKYQFIILLQLYSKTSLILYIIPRTFTLQNKRSIGELWHSHQLQVSLHHTIS